MHLFTSHGIHFFELMELGRQSGIEMPAIGAVYGIEIGECLCFGTGLSEKLQTRLGKIIDEIQCDIGIASLP